MMDNVEKNYFFTNPKTVLKYDKVPLLKITKQRWYFDL